MRFTFLFASLAILATTATAQTRHVLKATPENVVIGCYDAATPPVLRVRSGDSVEIRTGHVRHCTAAPEGIYQAKLKR